MQNQPQFVEVLPLTTWQRIRQILTVIAAVIAAITGSTAVSLQGCRGPVPPVVVPPVPPAPEPKPEPKPPSWDDVPPDPVGAVFKIQFGNAGCSASLVGPPLPDGRWQWVSAAHCFKNTPRTGVGMFANGQSVRLVLQGMWEGPDIAWGVTELPIEKLPYALLADAMPKAGEKVYHVGYGWDKPRNREEGQVVNPDNGQGQTEFLLNVSNGDSGGGIAMTADGRILSPVCCTTEIARKARVWGGTVAQVKKLRPLPTPAAEEWTPIDIPIRMPEP